jgi:hypothetical protein
MVREEVPYLKDNRKLEWGHVRGRTRVHLFVDGKRQCISSRGTPREMDEVFPNWNPDDPLTCRKCRERHRWISKGAVPVYQNDEHAETA